MKYMPLLESAEIVSTKLTSPRSYAPIAKSLKYSTWSETSVADERSAPGEAHRAIDARA